MATQSLEPMALALEELALANAGATLAGQETSAEPQEESSMALTLGILRSFNNVITDAIIFEKRAEPLPSPPDWIKNLYLCLYTTCEEILNLQRLVTNNQYSQLDELRNQYKLLYNTYYGAVSYVINGVQATLDQQKVYERRMEEASNQFVQEVKFAIVVYSQQTSDRDEVLQQLYNKFYKWTQALYQYYNKVEALEVQLVAYQIDMAKVTQGQ